jgi:hypothetical protein
MKVDNCGEMLCKSLNSIKIFVGQQKKSFINKTVTHGIGPEFYVTMLLYRHWYRTGTHHQNHKNKGNII